MNDTVYSVILSGPDLDFIEKADTLKANGGVKIDVVDVSYAVDVLSGKDKKEKKLLSNISFSLERGDMVALMGPSGAGKRKTFGKWSGEIYFNNEPRPKFMPSSFYAYVLQDDYHIATLTLMETIYYAAWTRMPRNTTKQEMNDRVEVLLDMMGLSHIRDSRVGDALHKGISGGQLKRLSIAVEIVSLPELIFLDEPTSGLDSSISLEIMKAVRELSNQNRTTVSTIHQPSPDLFALFSKLVLLSSGGRLIYFGRADEAVKYFSSDKLGYHYEEGQNPAEFVVDISGGKIITPNGTKRDAREMEMLYKSSDIYRHLKDVNYFASQVDDNRNNYNINKRCSIFMQFTMLITRAFIAKLRDTDDFKALLVKNIGTSLMVGVLYFGQGRTTEPLFSDGVPNASVYSVSSLLYFNLVTAVMNNAEIIPYVCNGDRLYRREIASGAYATLPFWLSQLLATLPIQFIPFFLYFVILYFLAGFPNDFGYFAYFISIIYLSNLASIYFAMFMAAATGNVGIALTFFPLTFVFLTNFLGFGINLNDLPVIWKYWAPAISYPKWAFEGLMVNQWESFNTDDSVDTYSGNGNVLSLYGFEGFNKFDAYWILLLFCSGCALLTLYSLLPARRKIRKVDSFIDNNESKISDVDTTSFVKSVTLAGTSTVDAIIRIGSCTSTSPVKNVMKGLRPQQDCTVDYYKSKSGDVAAATGCRLTFHDVSYSVVNQKDKSSKIKVLRGVSGFVNPGEMMALMGDNNNNNYYYYYKKGASGAGKSTLLDVLADRKNTGDIEGHINFNGAERMDAIMKSSAYVMQDNVHIGLLTVKETINYAAELRLDEHMSSEEKSNRVQTILDMLGLTEVADTLIGNERIRGISGGQLKRVSIAVEIVNLPDLMFFDEPTTGLDSAISFEVMAAIRGLANQNRTLICTIHQPSDDTFQLFDTLLLLAAGRVIYFGSVSSCVHYFTASVYRFSYQIGSNPADFVVAVAGSFLLSHDNRKICGDDLADTYMKSELGTHLQETINKLIEKDSHRLKISNSLDQGRNANKKNAYNTSTWHQMKVLCHRSYVLTLKDSGMVLGTLIMLIVTGLFYGSLFYQLAGGEDPTAYSNRLGLMYFALVFCMSSYQGEIMRLFAERLVFYRERGARAYGPLPYWFSFWYLQIPISVFNLLVFAVIIYFMCGLRAGGFGIFYLILLIVSLIGLFSCCFMAALIPTAEAIMSYMPLFFTFMMYTAGFAIYIPQMPSWLGTWAPYVSLMRFAFQAVVLNEFQDNGNLPLSQSYIDNLGFNTFSIEECVLFLLLNLFFYCFAFLLALKFVNFEKR